MRLVFASFGDRHAGLRNGLMKPGTELIYGQGDEKEHRIPTLSGWSDWLWHEVWLPGIEKTKEFAGDDRLILVDSGDMVHGSRFVEALYSPFVHHQVEIAVEGLRPWRQCPTLGGILMTYGTGSHDYGANAASEMVYDKLGAWGYKQWVSDHLRMDLGGFVLDLSHQGPAVSKIPHLRENSIRRDFRLIMNKNLEWGERYANVYQRGHVHVPASVQVDTTWRNQAHTTHVFITPPMCGPNGYARQATRSMERVTCGFYMWEMIDGKIGEILPHLIDKDTRTWHTVDLGTVGFNRLGNKKKKSKKNLIKKGKKK